MLRNWVLALASLLILSTAALAQDVPIYRSGAPNYSHVNLSGGERLAAMGSMDGKCENTESRLGYAGFDHCRMHPDYQVVFPSVGCNCYTGQCRPTKWRVAEKHSDSNPDGVEIYISGGWYPIPPGVLHKFYGDGGPRSVPLNMLDYDAHVCASDPSPKNPPHIECAWIKDPS